MFTNKHDEKRIWDSTSSVSKETRIKYGSTCNNDQLSDPIACQEASY